MKSSDSDDNMDSDDEVCFAEQRINIDSGRKLTLFSINFCSAS